MVRTLGIASFSKTIKHRQEMCIRDRPSALKLPNAGVSAPQPSFTMLEAAIDQETVGVYWEENLPLFYISSSLLKALNFTYDEFYLQCQGQLDLLLYPDDVGPAKAQARQALQQANQFEDVYKRQLPNGNAFVQRDARITSQRGWRYRCDSP